MEFVTKKTENCGVEIVQMRSLNLLGDALSLLTCYNSHVLTRELERNIDLPAEELQQNLLSMSSSSKQELEHRILLNVCRIVKNDPQCRLFEVFRRIIKADQELLEKIFTNNEFLLGSLSPKINRLKQELSDTEFPLSPQGKERLNGFLNFFSELEENLSNDKNQEIEPLSPTHQLEIKEYVIREFIAKSSIEDLVNILLREPRIEGLHIREILVNPNSSLGITQEQQKNYVFHLGCDFSGANMLTTYPFELLFDKEKQLMLGISHFLSVTATCELNLMISRYILEVSLGFRSHLVLLARKFYDKPDYVTVIIRRKKKTGGGNQSTLQMLCIDPKNENLFEDQMNEEIQSNILLSLIKPIQEFKNAVLLSDSSFDPQFLKDIEFEFNNKKKNNPLFDTKKISEGIALCFQNDENTHLEEYMSDRSPIHIFYEQWVKFSKVGEIKKEEEEEEVSQEFDENTHFFVYGTLRPDGNRSIQWCNQWNDCDEAPLRSRKGYIKKADLFVGRYPFVAFTKKKKEEESEEEEEEGEGDWKDHIVFGYIQDFEPKISKEKYMERLRYLDRVEGYPNFYNRKIVKGYIIKDGESCNFDKTKIMGDEEVVNVHLYYIDKDCFDDSTLVQSGDFIEYKQKK